MARARALRLDLDGHQERQEMPIGRDHIQPFNYSIFTNGNCPQGFSSFFSGVARSVIDPRSGFDDWFSNR
jgi:hypothetical protein